MVLWIAFGHPRDLWYFWRSDKIFRGSSLSEVVTPMQDWLVSLACLETGQGSGAYYRCGCHPRGAFDQGLIRACWGHCLRLKRLHRLHRSPADCNAARVSMQGRSKRSCWQWMLWRATTGARIRNDDQEWWSVIVLSLFSIAWSWTLVFSLERPLQGTRPGPCRLRHRLWNLVFC